MTGYALSGNYVGCRAIESIRRTLPPPARDLCGTASTQWKPRAGVFWTSSTSLNRMSNFMKRVLRQSRMQRQGRSFAGSIPMCSSPPRPSRLASLPTSQPPPDFTSRLSHDGISLTTRRQCALHGLKRWRAATGSAEFCPRKWNGSMPPPQVRIWNTARIPDRSATTKLITATYLPPVIRNRRPSIRRMRPDTSGCAGIHGTGVWIRGEIIE